MAIVVVAPSSADLSVCSAFDVVIARHDEKGLSRAVNHGWSLTPNAEFVSWLGDDDLLAPGSLRATVSFLERNPSYSMVYGRVRYIDEQGDSLWMSRPTRLAAPYLRAGKNFLSQQGSLIRRAAAEKVDWLDPELMNSMDQDMFTKLGAVGPRGYIPYELGAFRLHSAGITLSKGPTDESEAVRRRHWSEHDLRLYLAWRIVGRPFDRIVDAMIRRLPVPPVPLAEGRPYTAPAPSAAEDAAR